MVTQSFFKKYQIYLETFGVFLLAALVRLTSLNVFRAVDEEDRWAWATDFYQALLAGDLPATLVGDGYPGIFPVWLETIWLFMASLYRSALQGQWFGDAGVTLLIHEWSRPVYLGMQRFPVVFINTLLVVIIFLYLRKLFGRWVALLAAVLISLDPFYLSDSRVNRAEALLTGLMTISLLALVAALRNNSTVQKPASENKSRLHLLQFLNWRHLLVSAIFGGLAWLTKSQAIVLIPMFTVIALVWHLHTQTRWTAAARYWFITITAWSLIAVVTFIVLWPAAWTVPGPTFTLMFNYATGKVGEEGVLLFFMGQTVLDEDPGLLFYPVTFILRATPLMLVGLVAGMWLLISRQWEWSLRRWRTWLDEAGVWALLLYVLLYAGGMTLGSHKQDRFLMAAFPVFNTLAAMGFVGFAQRYKWSPKKMWIGIGALLVLQLVTALPYHPYYFSYFNPLAGGGPVASRLVRVGWGEGMDQVADYLQAQPNPETVTVATRFTHYLPGFEGRTLHLGQTGDWVRADKIVFYIQQTQRMLDPSPGVIRYFQQHVPPEKNIVINGIDYAQIYPNPIQYPADPLVDTIDDRLALFGYRWQADDGAANVRLIWENQSDKALTIGLRLWRNEDTHSPWLTCPPLPGFELAAQTPGEVVESECRLSNLNLPPGLYDLQAGVLQTNPQSDWQSLGFAAGWSAVDVGQNGSLTRVEPETVFARLAQENVPPSATPLEHTYYDHVRLLAYQIAPQKPQPGDSLVVTLYWQARRFLDESADVSLQAFVGDRRVALLNGPPLGGYSTRPTTTWQPGEVIEDVWQLDIPADVPAPALLRLDVGLFLPETLVPLPVRNLAGDDIPAAITYLRLEPERWPRYQGDTPVNFTFDNAIGLTGYEAVPAENNAVNITLYWQSLTPVHQDYTAFLHVLNSEGQLVAQSDVPPANGLLPTSAWQPGDTVLSHHQITLPAAAPPGRYTLLAGMYQPADGVRLAALDENNTPLPNNAAPIGTISSYQ